MAEQTSDARLPGCQRLVRINEGEERRARRGEESRAKSEGLRRRLSFAAAAAIVAGDILGSGIFFTPGELASVAQSPSQVYFLWTICGFITLCGALTLAELASLLPYPGATYHIIREAFGPFWGFLKIWVEMWISGPGSVAGAAIILGEFLTKQFGYPAQFWGAIAIAVFALINLLGVQWGGRTQIVLTSMKISALLALVFGSLLLADPTPVSSTTTSLDLLSFFRFIGLGIAAVLFTYDGWVDVTHVAGEVVDPAKNLPRALALGVAGITLLYLLVNFAFLRIVPLDTMREAPSAIAATVTEKTFGISGGQFLNALITISILGALGGLVMTIPRLFFAGASEYKEQSVFFRWIAKVSSKTSVPHGSIIFSAVTSIVALLFFQSFSRIVNFFVVPLQLITVLMVASIFRLRRKTPDLRYRTPGYPVVPLVFIVVMLFLLSSAAIYHPKDTLIGVGLTAIGIPFYLLMTAGFQERRL